jgi:hypothetical protein
MNGGGGWLGAVGVIGGGVDADDERGEDDGSLELEARGGRNGRAEVGVGVVGVGIVDVSVTSSPSLP